MKEKTPEEWFNTIADKGIREAAIANIDPSYFDCELYPKSLGDAFEFSFNWAGSKEGDYYWSDIWEMAEAGTLKLREVPEKEELSTLTIPDIRNKLSPITHLISMIERNEPELVKQAILQAKESVNYLAQREVYKSTPSKDKIKHP